MNKILKYLLIGIAVLAISGIGIGYYLYNKPHKDLSKQSAEFSLKSDDLYQEFSKNEQEANIKYLNKIIDVTGLVSEISANEDSSWSVVLRDSIADFGVNCNISNPSSQSKNLIKLGNLLVIRGSCSGFNGFDVALNNCAVIEK